MAYEKHEWECGETITADKMNNLENGIEEALQGGSASGIMILHDNGDYVAKLEKTWQEIYDHVNGGGIAFILSPRNNGVYLTVVGSVDIAGDQYNVNNKYSTDNPNDYPFYVYT